MNIRGIPVDRLLHSHLVPSLPQLVKQASVNVDVKSSINAMCIISFSLRGSFICLVGAICMSALVGRVSASELTVGPITSAVLLLASLIGHCCLLQPAKAFTKDVNRLDDLLVVHGLSKGIVDLPPALSEIFGVSKSLIQSAITEVRRMETDEKCSLEETERIRRQYRELASLLREKFHMDVGSFAPMFLEAEKVTVEEWAQQEEEKSMSDGTE